LREGHGLLRQIEAFDMSAILSGPVYVSREANQGLIDIDATYAGTAAQRRIKNLNIFHWGISIQKPKNVAARYIC